MEPQAPAVEEPKAIFQSAQLMSSSSFRSVLHLVSFSYCVLDDEIRSLGIPEHAIEIYRRMRYQSNFGVESWYSALQDHTFQTIRFDLDYDHAEALSKPQRLRTDSHLCVS